MKILIIEPDTILGRTYERALHSDGHTVVTRPSAQTAIHAIDQNLPDLIILELQLAKHSGIEFLYELRSYPDWQDVPVLLHTMVPASALSVSQKTLQTLDARAYLYKPHTTLRQLLAFVQTIPQTVSQ